MNTGILKNKRKKYRLKEDEEGSILPMIAVVLILSIFLGAVNFALVVMYRDRAVVRNALDAAVTSSLAAVAVEKFKPIKYMETDVVTKTAFIDCYTDEFIGYDSEGEEMYETVDNSFWTPREIVWQNTEYDVKNYIQLDVGTANSVAKDYFEKNMKLNSLDYNIKDWTFSAEYDDKRIYEVEKNRSVVPIRPAFVPGVPPSGANCDAGVPDVYNQVTNPDAWWFSDFAGASTGSWSPPSNWSTSIYETTML